MDASGLNVLQLDLAQSHFDWGGREYTVLLQFTTGEVSTIKQPSSDVVVPLSKLIKFEYVNELNTLSMRGKIEFVDSTGIAINLIAQPNVFCRVSIYEYLTKSDTKNIQSTFKTKDEFIHDFVVEKMNIVRRDGPNLQYEVDIRDINWFKCNTLARFQNYDNKSTDGQSLLDIIQNCMQNANMKLDLKSFENASSRCKINYITSANDTLESAIAYLLQTQFYFKVADESIQFIMYDEFNDTYGLVSMDESIEQIKRADTITVTMNKGSLETMMNGQQVDINALDDSGYSNFYKSTSKRTTYDFDYDTCQFIKVERDVDTNLKVLNAARDDDIQEKRYQRISFKQQNYSIFDSYWSNENHSYTDFSKILTKYRTLIVNVNGRLGRQPGNKIKMIVQRTCDQHKSSNIEQNAAMDKQFEVLMKTIWTVSRVRTTIQVNAEQSGSQRPYTFKQTMMLFDNSSINDVASSEATTSGSTPSSSKSSN